MTCRSCGATERARATRWRRCVGSSRAASRSSSFPREPAARTGGSANSATARSGWRSSPAWMSCRSRSPAPRHRCRNGRSFSIPPRRRCASFRPCRPPARGSRPWTSPRADRGGDRRGRRLGEVGMALRRRGVRSEEARRPRSGRMISAAAVEQRMPAAESPRRPHHFQQPFAPGYFQGAMRTISASPSGSLTRSPAFAPSKLCANSL